MVAVGAVPRSLRDQVDIVSGLRQRDAFAVEYAAVIPPHVRSKRGTLS